MQTRRSLLRSATALVAASLIIPGAATADEPLPVVATFSILGDMVSRIGGEHIALTTLVGPGGDAHVYQPNPQDAAAVADADVLFMNGLEFEGWLERLAGAAPFDGQMVIATTGIDAIAFEDDHGDEHDDHDDHGDEDKHDEDHGEEDHAEGDDHDHDHGDDEAHDDHEGEDHAEDDDHDDHDKDHADHDDHDDHGEDHAGHDHGIFDPHAWQTIENAVVYVDNITAGLAQADPDNAATYYANRAAYVAELQALEAEIDALIAGVPDDKRTVVTSHDAFGYFGAHYGMTFAAPQGLSTESEASAADVAALITQIREDGISAVFVESVADSRLIEQIANETDAVVGGELFAGSLSLADGPAPTYIDMMRHNAITLAAALGN